MSRAGAAQGTGPTFCLQLSAPFALASQLADLLAESGETPPAVSIHETDDPQIWKLCAYYPLEPDEAAIQKLLESCGHALPPLELTPIEPQDWVAQVQRGLQPVRAGRFFIYGHHDRAQARQFAGDIEIDAGQAFGTAHHGTTKGCLLALDALFKKQNGRKFRQILDLGTGTGLLAIAAARSLQRPVLASDIDPVSVRIANENAALNTVGPLVRTVQADGLHHPVLRSTAPFDLIIANILAEPLLVMAPDIRKNMARRGYLVLSGLLQSQSRMIEARYCGFGFKRIKRLPLDEWMTLILQAT